MKLILVIGTLLLVTVLAFPLGVPEGASGSSGGGGTQLITMLVTFGLILLLPSTLLGLIPATIARHKGRKFGRWWVYGWLLFIKCFDSFTCSKRKEVSLLCRTNSTRGQSLSLLRK